MAFRFPLQAVLRLRQGYERRERLRLEALAAQIALVLSQLSVLEHQSLVARQRATQMLLEGMAGSELHFEALRSAAFAGRRVGLLERLAELERQHRAQQLAYQEARRQKEVIDSLRSRQLGIFRLQQARREQQQLDELFLMRQAGHSDRSWQGQPPEQARQPARKIHRADPST
jgi:flagellar FliJ protein